MEKEFTFNDCNVCTNPNIPIDLPQGGGGIISMQTLLQIKTAKVRKGWVGGYFYSCHNGGGSYPCCKKGATFGTENEAIEYYLTQILNNIRSYEQKGNTLTLANFIIEKLEGKIQLKIF